MCQTQHKRTSAGSEGHNQQTSTSTQLSDSQGCGSGGVNFFQSGHTTNTRVDPMPPSSLSSGNGNAGQLNTSGVGSSTGPSKSVFGLPSVPSASTVSALPTGLELDLRNLSISSIAASGSDQPAGQHSSVQALDSAEAAIPARSVSSSASPSQVFSFKANSSKCRRFNAVNTKGKSQPF